MKQLNADEGNYKCDVGETVIITLHPDDDSHFGAAYTFSDHPSPAQPVINNKIEFSMQGQWMRIFVTFFFTGEDGSSEIRLQGGNGGNFKDPFDVYRDPTSPPVAPIRYWTFES